MSSNPITPCSALSRRSLVAAAFGLALPITSAARPTPDPSRAVLFKTRSEAEHTAMPSRAREEGIFVLGYHVPHDGGGGWYRFAYREPAHPAAFRARDGSYWELETNELWFRQLGARGNGVADDTRAVQDALAAAAALGLTARVGAGSFVISADLELPVGERCVDVTGEGWNASRLVFHGPSVRRGLFQAGRPGAYPYAGAVRNLRIDCRAGAQRAYTASWVNHPRLERVIITGAQGSGVRFEHTLMGSLTECLLTGCGSPADGVLEVDRSTTFLWLHSRISGSAPGASAGVLIDRSSGVTLEGGNVESAGVPIRIGSLTEGSLPCEQIRLQNLDLERPTGSYLEAGLGWTGAPGGGVIGLILDNLHGTPSGAAAITYGARFRNTRGLEVRRARFGLPRGARASFLFEGRNAGAVIRAQAESQGGSCPWVVEDGRPRADASPAADWRL